jgi:Cu/Ag efflux protein CusF
MRSHRQPFDLLNLEGAFMNAVRLLTCIAVVLSSLDSSAQGMSMPAKPTASAAAMPLVDGEVRRIERDKGLVVLRHGDIPNIGMPAMTMGFDVGDKKMLDGLKVGDKVRFQAEMVKGKATVTVLKRTAAK